MHRFIVLLAAAGIACSPACATDREFKDVVNAISEEFHAQPMHIPFFGLVNFVTFVARPAGTKHIDLAVFEHLDARDRDGLDIARSIQRSVGHAWKPFVRVISNKGGHQELVLVYFRPDGHDCKFLITSVEPDEATVVQLKLNPDALQRFLESPRFAAMRHGGGEHRSGDEDR